MAIETISPELEIESLLTRYDEQYADEYDVSLLESWVYRETVRQKYGLPECAFKFDDPVRYIQEITDYCKKNGINIRESDEFASFFSENPKAEAVSFGGDSTIIVDRASDDDWFALRARAKQLSHEVVHSMQDKLYPDMPDEVAEREAYYYQLFDSEKIKEHVDNPGFLYHWVGTTIENYIENSTKMNEKINGENKSVSSISDQTST